MAEDKMSERIARVEATMDAHIKSCEEDRDERRLRWAAGWPTEPVNL